MPPLRKWPRHWAGHSRAASRPSRCRSSKHTGPRARYDYDGKAFGFASRNFYTEFLAALEVERDYKEHFGEVTFEPRLQYQEIKTQHFLRFSTAAKLARCSVEQLRDLNPGFTNDVFDGKLYVPKGYTLRVPASRASEFASSE